MKIDFTEQVIKEFDWLFSEYNAEITRQEREDPECFGDALISMRLQHFQLKFVRDRHQKFIYFCLDFETDNWHSLYFILQLVGVPQKEAEEMLYFEMELSDQSALLKSYFPGIQKLLSPDSAQKTIKSLNELYAENV